jgi:hypothetical protein
MFFLEQEKQSSEAPPAGARLLRFRTADGSLTVTVGCAIGAVIFESSRGEVRK